MEPTISTKKCRKDPILSSVLVRAMDAHTAGRLDEAEASYREILAADPDHADAIHLLGVIAFQRGALDDALSLIRRAIAVDEGVALYHSNLGRVAKAAGRLDEAVTAYRRALTSTPRSAAVYSDLAAALLAMGNIAESIQSSRTALALDPKFANAHYNLGLALRELGWKAEAEISFRKALAVDPDRPDVLFNLGLTLHEMDDLDGAADFYRRALVLAPGLTDALCNLGNAARAQGRWEQAIGCYRQALAQSPEQAEVHMNLGVALQETGGLAEALPCYERALSIAPDDPETHRNRALALLQSGRLSEGWAENEWRWRTRAFQSLTLPSAAPLWEGEPIEGKTVLIYAEQGLGDTLHFARYAPMVAAGGANVVLHCQEALASLLGRVEGVGSTVAAGVDVPRHDIRVPLLSLPRIFDTTTQSIPGRVPYVAASPSKARVWQAKLAKYPGLKVGLVWAGDPRHRNDRNRSMPAAALSPLLAIEGVRFFSLQLGERRQEVTYFPADTAVDLSSDIASFEDTAAIMANLDLVVTVDTAACHLAGALGRPVWVLLSVAHDWRWFEAREDSPWYPTMRLFRQARAGDWADVIDRVADALAQVPGRVGRMGEGVAS